MKLSSVACQILLAQNGAGGGQGDGGLLGLGGMMVPLLAIMVFGYFLLVRPQQKEQANRKRMLEQIKKNDHVVTVGGIYGVVTNVRREADEVTIKVDEANNTKLRLTLSAVSRVVADDAVEEKTSK